MSALSFGDREPVVVRAAATVAVTALVHLAVVLGWLSVDAEKAVTSAVDALGALVLVLLVRPAVTSNAKVVSRVTTSGTVVAGDAAERPTGAPVAIIDAALSPVVEPVAVRSELIAPPAGDADLADD